MSLKPAAYVFKALELGFSIGCCQTKPKETTIANHNKHKLPNKAIIFFMQTHVTCVKHG